MSRPRPETLSENTLWEGRMDGLLFGYVVPVMVPDRCGVGAAGRLVSWWW
ncbi:hypothetical protein AB5J55_01145 [Streptomyces sp. R11]|uniref:Uncharacterized protein n=1 Tax=Streptomyces sp. R11 TaxID=3238625 RepID=A0AB39MPW6_9ACTN